MDFVWISDFLKREVSGGAECNDAALRQELSNMGHSVQGLKCENVTVDFLEENKDKKFIVSNMIMLMPSVKKYLMNNCDYLKYEHDHQYLISRNPADYDDFIAPDEDKQNIDFYQTANAVMAQSQMHQDLINKNVKCNTVNLSGNCWTEEELDFISSIDTSNKKDAVAIMDSQTWHKNTKGAIKVCNSYNWDYDLISSPNWEEFIEQLAQYEKYLFIPLTPESLSRVLVEARMLECKVVSRNAGVLGEKWFEKLNGDELVDFMRKKRREIAEKVIEVFDE